MSWATVTADPLNQKTQTESQTTQGLSRTITTTNTLTDAEVDSLITTHVLDVLPPKTVADARAVFREVSNPQISVMQALERVRVWAKRFKPTTPP